jgi:hypothetical protein
MQFEVLQAVTTKNIIIRDVKLCGLLEACRLSEERTVLTLMTEAVCSFESLENIYKTTHRNVPEASNFPLEHL